ncbi:uncharacterized protein (TIGR02679 family) [Breznakia blatticola]|uniref:Uncharacterized protein (TIGR02679 family) n=1 Tax=Breznakia blatticola TaxID=1754012 RepID=A0A4R7ZH61_9FIRM|nr:TIGR02679 domain-containing protein [Breznakia blatticola]TDW16535.1 uncharacterized protein (TIGR02679 family) [Breznakia blatticola]
MIEQFVRYLKDTPGLVRFMDAWKEKYIKLNTLGGTIKLDDLSTEEKSAIGALIGRDLSQQNSIVLSYTKLIKALRNTRFEEVDFQDVVLAYYDGCIVSKKEENAVQQEKRKILKHKLFNDLKATIAYGWLVKMEVENPSLFTQMLQQYKRNPQRIMMITQALNTLPIWENKVRSLSVFASSVAQDPHFFDGGSNLNFLLHAIQYALDVQETPTSRIEKNEILARAGLLKEETTNYITVFQVQMKNKKNIEDVGLTWFTKQGQSINLHIGNLQTYQEAYGSTHILILENPSVFQVLQQYLIDQKIKNVGIVCTYGELTLAAYKLLDILKLCDAHLYYAGDFDPEGVLIAQRVSQRLEGNISFLHYTKSDFECASAKAIHSDSRLQKLENVSLSDLSVIKECIREFQTVGYQEALLTKYMRTIDVWNMSMK